MGDVLSSTEVKVFSKALWITESSLKDLAGTPLIPKCFSMMGSMFSAPRALDDLVALSW